MKRKETAASFSLAYDAKKQRKDISDTSFALILPGAALALIFGLRAIVSEGFAEIFSIAAAVCGLVLIALGTFLPQLLRPVTKKVFSFFNRIGLVILKALLLPVYFITFLFTFPFAKNKKAGYSFARWDGAAPGNATFFSKPEDGVLNQRKGLRVIGSIFSGIAAHKMYFLIPLIVVLLLIGLLFFFLSSSAVFSFIYTFV